MIGIFGGTFDPVHNGHLQTVLHVQQHLGLEKVHLIPLGQAVHRQQPEASSEQRLQMLQAATENHPELIIDDREIRREGGSYTYHTLRSIKAEHPQQTLCLITGSDAFSHFAGWYMPEQILQMAHLIVMRRPDEQVIPNASLQQILDKHLTDNIDSLQQNRQGRIIFLDVPQIPISSTLIRENLAADKSIDNLLPLSVQTLIADWQLYRSN